MEHKVRKGLESNFLIYGCTVKAFYVLLGCATFETLYIVGDILSALRSGHFSTFMMHLILNIGIFIALWFFLVKKSKKSKYKFGKRESTISNKDILNYIK
jgi:hypothetical protein